MVLGSVQRIRRVLLDIAIRNSNITSIVMTMPDDGRRKVQMGMRQMDAREMHMMLLMLMLPLLVLAAGLLYVVGGTCAMAFFSVGIRRLLVLTPTLLARTLGGDRSGRLRLDAEADVAAAFLDVDVTVVDALEANVLSAVALLGVLAADVVADIVLVFVLIVVVFAETVGVETAGRGKHVVGKSVEGQATSRRPMKLLVELLLKKIRAASPALAAPTAPPAVVVVVVGHGVCFDLAQKVHLFFGARAFYLSFFAELLLWLCR